MTADPTLAAIGYLVLGWVLGLLTAMVLGPFARRALEQHMLCIHGEEPARCNECNARPF